MPNYSDEDITLFMGLYRDRERAQGALGRIREHFPDARVIVRSDGDRDPFAYRHESSYFARMAGRVDRTGLCSFDWIIAWVANELQIPMFSLSEFRWHWQPENNVTNDDLKYAVTHPVYFLD